MSDGGDDFETVYDKHTRTFIRRPRSHVVEPSSPESPQAGTVYDKNSRSFVPKRESTAFTVTPIQSDRVASPDQRPRIYRSAEPAEDPALLPPPRNPARLSPDSASPTSPRTPQILHKQPSVVREDPEAEQQAETLSPISNDPREISEATPAAAGPSKVYVAPATPHDRKASLDVPPQISSAGRGRDKSASPSRSPHFSPSPIISAERHDPPPRGVSPVKSAMKHSPASSVRTASPIANFSPNVAPSTNTVSPSSEVSEGVSAQDVLDSSKKKKFVRVSFDEHTQEIQVADTATDTTAPDFDEEDDDAIMKPRPALPSFGSVRRTNMQPQLAEKVTEMPPERHDLSSDHAIGGILRSSLAPLPPEVTSKESAGYSSDDSSEMEVPAVASAANPDRAEAGAGLEPQREGPDPIVKDFASALVDRGAEDQEADNDNVPAINLLPPTPGIEDDSKKDLSDQEDSFQARAKARNSVEIVVPGGWGEDDENEDESFKESAASQSLPNITTQEASAAAQTAMLQPNESPVLHASPQQLSDIDEDSDDSAEFSDAYEDPSEFEEGGFASLDAIVESPIVMPSVVEAKSKPRVLTAREPPESPTIQPVTRKTENTDPSGAQDWGRTTAYWSQLSREKREQIERQHLSSDDDAAPAPKSTTARTTRNAQQAAAGSGLTALPLSKAAKQTSSAQQEPTIRKTMRAQTGPAPASASAKADEGVHMRRSMRSSGGLTPSLRSGPPSRRPQSEYVEPKGTLQKKNIRPMSSTSIASSSSGSTQRPSSASGLKSQDSSFPSFPTKTSAPQRRAEPPKVSTRLQRELAKADDSDSESSFKRRRRANSGSTLESGGKYSMRRSMRGASIDETPTPAPVERRPQSPDLEGSKSGFRLRSLSPPSLFGRKKTETPPPPPPTNTRATLRSAPAPKSTGGKSAPPSRASAPPAPRFKSRFADSDDSDDEAAPSRSFRSRFAESDDDEPAAPSGLTPVRGIPRKAGRYDGDSTDLEDSDEDRPGKQSKGRSKVTPLAQDPAEIEKAMAAARRNLGMSEEPAAKPKPVNEGSALAKGSLRNKPEPVKEDTPVLTPLQEVPMPITTPRKEKRGFMSSILRRNRNSSSSIQQIRPTSPPPPMPTSPAVKTSPVGNEQTVTDSPSTPTGGKLIRRQSDQPQIARVNSDYSIATAPPISDTTTAVATQNDEDWPLPSPPTPPVPPIPADLQGDVARPTTSEGFSPEAVKLARTMRPDLTPRSKSGPQQRVRIQAGEEGSEPGEREKDMKAVYSRRTGKKKKFGMLRRAFGIDD